MTRWQLEALDWVITLLLVAVVIWIMLEPRALVLSAMGLSGVCGVGVILLARWRRRVWHWSIALFGLVAVAWIVVEPSGAALNGLRSGAMLVWAIFCRGLKLIVGSRYEAIRNG